MEHERTAIQRHYPAAEYVQYDTPEEGFSALLQEMASGADAIFGLPVFYLPQNLQGQIDALVKRTDHASSFGRYHYVVLEIKLAKNIRRKHVLQAAFYTYILGKIQEYTPKTFLILNGDEQISEYRFEDYRDMLALAMKGTQAILDGREKPSATYNGCDWPWTSFANQRAFKKQDVSLISQVGQETRDKLVNQGYRSVGDIALASEEELVTTLGIRPGRARRLILSAQAIGRGEPISTNPAVLSFPQKSTEIFLDLEGSDQSTDQGELAHVDYLIGILTRKDGEETYRPLIAHRLQDEGEMFRTFLRFMRSQIDYVIYHWHHYERWHIKQLGERYGFVDEVASLLFPHMIDLHKVATRAFVFPTYRNGLKDIAGFLGFKWRHKDMNALDAIAYYLRYQEDPEGLQEEMQAIVAYNEDDCIATRIVKDWLQESSIG
jgi:uncharacterized protein